ncbi:four helix bundle protein [Fimbriimonas ginsengisoli]|uniref:four helix bundle protein n=1 Tax=Fimbriimonas ginsengisoli TaxID=1005039 RepID=UPI00046D3AA9|nr:four helix bundle protein [Fimbriimonas ginsengisoli]
MAEPVKHHRDLEVRKKAFALAMRIFELSSSFPKEERYALTDQIRRSSRSVTANMAEAWQKRRYEAAFCAKLSDSCAEAAETQEWLDFAFACGYIDSSTFDELDEGYSKVLSTLRAMQFHSAQWCLREQPQSTIHKPQST